MKKDDDPTILHNKISYKSIKKKSLFSFFKTFKNRDDKRIVKNNGMVLVLNFHFSTFAISHYDNPMSYCKIKTDYGCL